VRGVWENGAVGYERGICAERAAARAVWDCDFGCEQQGYSGRRTLGSGVCLQLVNGEWRLGGFNVKALRSGGHDSAWFAEKGRAFAAKGQKHNAWYYLLEARNLATVRRL